MSERLQRRGPVSKLCQRSGGLHAKREADVTD